MGDYLVRCVIDGSVHPSSALVCQEHDSLLRTHYSARRLELRDMPGIWRFYDWLPVKGIIPEVCQGSVTYRSSDLGDELGLKNLYISFSGYWPERGARMPTCSFKDLEAAPTMQRLREHGQGRPLVVASAGNTARAFADAAARTGQRTVLFVPEGAVQRVWTSAEPANTVLVAVRGDYADAISVADSVQRRTGLVPEGGARNIARRDGMGTVMLEAAVRIGRMPEHYFQAIGSGTGGISAWEAAMRLVSDGRFGQHLPRLHLAQSLPNAPIYYAWSGREPGPYAQHAFDDVLFNRHPPYWIAGGVRDALSATGGCVYGITDEEAWRAKRLFEECEGVDILRAPAVAVAALEAAVRSGSVGADDLVLLNITGGGEERLREEGVTNQVQPDGTVSGWQEALQLLEEMGGAWNHRRF
ncbi:MAG: cysteate synthase [Methanothrix sp.]|nr:cysteate synthase [Methanothrix sp.]